ncbi:hypothetical protein ABPG72_021115 [Tetrahymena utriculariae]
MQFTLTTPTLKVASELGLCSQYSGQTSCRDQNIVKFIDIAAVYKVKQILQSYCAFEKLIKTNISQLYRNYNSGDLLSTNLNVNDLLNNFNNKDSVNQFQSKTDQSIAQYSSFLSDSNIESIVTQLDQVYIKNQTSTCKTFVINNLKEIFKNHQVNNYDNGNRICDGKIVSGDNPKCENILQGQIYESQNNIFLKLDDYQNEINRQIYAIINTAINAQSANVFIESQLDDYIDEQGTLQGLNFDEVITKFSSCIAIGSFLGLFILLL